MDSPSDIKSIPSSFKIPPFPTPSSPLLNLSAPLRLRAKLSSIQNPVTSALRPHNHPHPHGLLRHSDAGAASCRRADDEERIEFLLVDRADTDRLCTACREGVSSRFFADWAFPESVGGIPRRREPRLRR